MVAPRSPDAVPRSTREESRSFLLAQELQRMRRAASKEESVHLIEHDISRTLAYTGMFNAGIDLNRSLRVVLGAYAMARPDVGYVQGMNYLAGMFLLYMEPEAAFMCLTNLLNRMDCGAHRRSYLGHRRVRSGVRRELVAAQRAAHWHSSAQRRCSPRRDQADLHSHERWGAPRTAAPPVLLRGGGGFHVAPRLQPHPSPATALTGGLDGPRAPGGCPARVPLTSPQRREGRRGRWGATT